MQFNNLALTGWSYEKGDRKIDVEELNISSAVKTRNPVQSTYVYSDESKWKNSLQEQSVKAVQMSGINQNDIQAFFGVHNGYKRHPEPASPEVQSMFPQSTGFILDFSLGCASVIMAAQLAGLHMYEESVNNIVFGSVQLTTQYTENYTDGNCLFADSIGAMVFSKQETGNLVRYTEISSNSEFRDMFQLNDDGIYHLKNLQKGRELSTYMVKAFGGHLMKGCRALKTYPKDVDFIAMSASTYGASKMVLEQMQFPLERSGIECLTKVPHMGTNDLIFQIEYGLEQGLIKPGSKILVTGTSLGFSIATMAIEWGIQ
jgi:3-oxoacyl-[acyl-carrier-protein] synthase III